MAAAVARELAVSRACDCTDALSGLRPPDRVDGVRCPGAAAPWIVANGPAGDAGHAAAVAPAAGPLAVDLSIRRSLGRAGIGYVQCVLGDQLLVRRLPDRLLRS